MSAAIESRPAARYLGTPTVRGVVRAVPDDFDVTEVLGFEPSGDGPHWLLQVEKSGVNTLDMIAALARHAGVRARDVGYCGLKDRHARTRQWLSLPDSANADWDGFASASMRIVGVTRNRRKLRIGAHAGNAFRLTLREISGDIDDLRARTAAVAAGGVPNYFGPQRFGIDGDNLRRARRWFVDGMELGRRQRRFALSAARSWLFNRVVDRRVREGSWNVLLPGEPASLNGSRSFFMPPSHDDAELLARLRSGDVHPSGPLWGRGDSPALADCAALEQQVASEAPWLARGLEEAGVKQERRALRLPVEDLQTGIEGDVVTLTFTLGKGAFATSVLHELVDIDGGYIPA